MDEIITPLLTSFLAIIPIILKLLLRISFYAAVTSRLWIHILNERYLKATIIIIITGLLSWKIALIEIIYAVYRVYKIKEAGIRAKITFTSAPGSSSDYERWKTEREAAQDNK